MTWELNYLTYQEHFIYFRIRQYIGKVQMFFNLIFFLSRNIYNFSHRQKLLKILFLNAAILFYEIILIVFVKLIMNYFYFNYFL